jgi:fatty acid desaturase
MRIEWPTIAMIAACYGLWFLIGLYVWPVAPAAALVLMAFPVALHSSLQHEALHGHPTRKAWINELTVGLLPLAPAYPFRRFKTLHLRHHHDERLTDPYDDPESYYLDGRHHAELRPFLRWLLSANNTLAGRMIFGPPLMVWGFVSGDLRAIAAGDRRILTDWLLHLAGLAMVALVTGFVFGMPFWLHTLVAGWLGMSIIAIRTFCEHQAADAVNHRTIIVEKSPLSWLFLNNNLHLVHHKAPGLAWYKLPALMRERRDEWITMNGGYVFGGYGSIFRRFALRGKEPVVHPNYPVMEKASQTVVARAAGR